MNINTMKRTCKRCKAGTASMCDLGYNSYWWYYEDMAPWIAFGIPKEPCPKPLTYSDYLYAHKWYKK